MNTIVLLLYGISLLIFVMALLWILVPAFYGLPSKPTNPDRIRKALKLVELKQDETVYDLGAGDGRVLFIAAREFGAQAVGVEVGPVQWAWIQSKILFGGLRERVRIGLRDLYKTDLGTADVVYFYGTSREVRKLAPYLKKQMKAGARLVSISADFPEWEPSKFDEESLIFTYDMPPKEGNLTTYLLKRSK